MRLLVLLVLGLTLGPACKSKPNASPDARDDEWKVAQAQLLARRDEILRERKRLGERRAALTAQREQGKLTAAEEEAFRADEAKLERSEDDYMQLMATVATSGQDVARREAGLALRESSVARREERVAEREAQLAAREKAQAQRERETCATTVTVPTYVPAPGSKYSKRDVEPVLQKARRKMAEHGILASDLPPPAQALEREATQAMAEGDYGRAKFAADQLYATIGSLRIDRAFIAAKIGRLNGSMKGKTPTSEVQDLFREATADYGDGRFAAANTRLNKIYGLIR